MDEDLKKRLADYFTGPELVDVLDVPVTDLVELLEEYILDKVNEIQEYMNYGTN